MNKPRVETHPSMAPQTNEDRLSRKRRIYQGVDYGMRSAASTEQAKGSDIGYILTMGGLICGAMMLITCTILGLYVLIRDVINWF